MKDLHQVVATINTTVKNLRTVETESGVAYRIQFADSFPAIVKTGEDYEDGEADYISFQPRVLIAQVLQLVDGADILYTRRHEAAIRTGSADFGAAEISAILRNAKIVLERSKFEAGEEYTVADEVRTHEFTGYNTQIVSIEVTPRVARQMDALLDSVLSI